MPSRVTIAALIALNVFAGVLLPAQSAPPQSAPVPSAPSTADRQALGDAWWTGPLLANSAATLPRGHILVEPYVYDVISPHTNGMGSRAYVLYGLFNRFTVGFIPIIGYNIVSNGPNSSHVGFADFTPQAQFRLHQYHEGSWIPTTSIMVQQTFPTSAYDKLSRPSNGFGGGVYSTNIALNTQTYFWMPNGRILRVRLDISDAFSTRANLQDASVYGTSAGFRGHAYPGAAFQVDLAGEYSVTRKWVLALDAIYHQAGNTPVIGVNTNTSTPVRLDSGSSAGFGFAPAIEYNWNSRVGVIVGTRIIAPALRNSTTTITPAIAINYVR